MATYSMNRVPGRIAGALLADGWRRSDYPADQIGECLAFTGCSRPGRWTHPHVTGYYCAHHAYGDGRDVQR